MLVDYCFLRVGDRESNYCSLCLFNRFFLLLFDVKREHFSMWLAVIYLWFLLFCSFEPGLLFFGAILIVLVANCLSSLWSTLFEFSNTNLSKAAWIFLILEFTSIANQKCFYCAQMVPGWIFGLWGRWNLLHSWLGAEFYVGTMKRFSLMGSPFLVTNMSILC